MGQKLYMDNFSSLALFVELHTKTINCCGTISKKIQGMLKNFRQKIKLKRGDIKTTVRENLTASVERQKTGIVTNMHSPPAEGSFCDENGKSMSAAIVKKQ
jgi:hypothetical protein